MKKKIFVVAAAVGLLFAGTGTASAAWTSTPQAYYHCHVSLNNNGIQYTYCHTAVS